MGAAAARDHPDPAALALCTDAPPVGQLDDLSADEREAASSSSSSSSLSLSSSSSSSAAAAALACIPGVNFAGPAAKVKYCSYCGWEGHKTNRSRACTFNKDYVDGANQGRKKNGPGQCTDG